MPMSMAEVESQGQTGAAQSAPEHDPMVHCWMCGKVVKDPKLYVEEGIYDFGVFRGWEITGVIHKTCSEKGKKEYAGYKWRVLEQ